MIDLFSPPLDERLYLEFSIIMNQKKKLLVLKKFPERFLLLNDKITFYINKLFLEGLKVNV